MCHPGDGLKKSPGQGLRGIGGARAFAFPLLRAYALCFPIILYARRSQRSTLLNYAIPPTGVKRDGGGVRFLVNPTVSLVSILVRLLLAIGRDLRGGGGKGNTYIPYS